MRRCGGECCGESAASGYNEHGNVLPVYAAMGKPLNPTPTQVEEMNREDSAAECGGGKAEVMGAWS